jgi:hypothetical protein
MKVFLLIWITLLLFPFGLYSQGDIGNSAAIDYNYDQYRETFKSELNALETSGIEENAVISAGISPVPDWLLLPISVSSSTINVIGISDPGIDSTTARSQAIFRALFLGSLMSGSALSNLVDLFSQDFDNKKSGYSGQYVDYFEFSSQVPCGISEAKVIKENYTDFGECIVMIEYQVIPDPIPALTFKTIGMITEFEKDGVYECHSRIEFNGQSLSNPGGGNFQYISRSINDLVEVESYYQDKLLQTLPLKLKYSLPDSIYISKPEACARTDRGLWNALLASVIKAVTLEIRTQPTLFESASDHYTGTSQSLNREAIKGNLTFSLDQVIINDNKLWAILDHFKFSQP